MEIDWIKFLKKEFPKGKEFKGRNGLEWNIDCVGEDCPNPKYHMFINMGSDNPEHDKRFICHRCGFSGNHKAFLMAYYGLPYNEIMQNIDDFYGSEKDPFSKARSTAKVITKLALTVFDKLSGEDEGFIIDLPKGYVKLKKQTKFLKMRNIPVEMIREFKIGRCNSGFYKHRLVFPIETNKNRSFLAYSQLSKKALLKFKELHKENPNSSYFDNLRKKIRNPKGSLHSMLLYNYNKVSKGEDIVFIQEGALDCIRTVMNEHVPVGIFSKYMSAYQAELLADKEPNEICIMLDADADTDEVIKIMKTLKDHCDCPISYVRLKSGDPDNIKSKQEFKNTINTRKYTLYDYMALSY